MNYRKIAALLAAASLTAGALSGCGSSTTETTAAADTTAQTDAATDTDAAADGAVYHIGICQLVQHQALDQATAGFEAALTELGEENGVTFIFDEQNASGDAQMCNTIANQFVSSEYDLIMANATASLQACANATSEIPVVATSITSFAAALDIDMDDDQCTGINVTGTNDLAPLSEQAQMVRDLCPDAETVGILYCSAEVNSVYQAEHIEQYLIDLGFTPTFYTFADSNELPTVTQQAVSENDCIYIPTDNTAAANAEGIDNIARRENVPIITGDDGSCKYCGLATFSVDFYAIGYRAGEMSYDILVNGADPATLPVEDPQVFNKVYNAEIAEYYGIEFGEDYSPLEE